MTYNDLNEVRAERNLRLAAYDHYFFTDVSDKTSDIELTAFAVYRQTLRDIPESFSEDATDIEVAWPEKPSLSV